MCYNIHQQVLVSKNRRKGQKMNATKTKGTENRKILVDTVGLQEMLSSGRQVALEIGTAANAKVCSGRRIFWNVRKVQQYIDTISK